jgi:pyruvate oxidase
VAAWTAEVHAGSDHAELAALAVKHALDARGVAHLVLPDEVQTQPSDAAAKTPRGRLAERLNAPVLTTFKAKGLIPDTHPLGAGVLGRSGTPVASWLMNEADLLIVVGASFANHNGIAPYKAILQIDDNPAAIGRFDPVGTGITGDAALTLDALLGGAGRDPHRGPASGRGRPVGHLAGGKGPAGR